MPDSDLAELERRIGAALTRIATATEAVTGSAGQEGPGVEAVSEAVSAAVSDAVAEAEAARAAEGKARAEADMLAEKIARLEEALETESLAVEQLRQRNHTLKQAKDEAQSQAADLEGELKALSQARAEDRAELDAIVAALDPLVAEQPNA